MGDQQKKTQGQMDKDRQSSGQPGGQRDKNQPSGQTGQWDKNQPGGQTGQTPQVGTHGSDPKAGTAYGDKSQQQRDMSQGDYTRPAQPSGTTPLERDQQPVRKER